jgi:hypothetical protein
MADIDVVKKESGSKLWLWILLIAVAALIIWFMMSGSQPEQVGALDDAWRVLSGTALA